MFRGGVFLFLFFVGGLFVIFFSVCLFWWCVFVNLSFNLIFQMVTDMTNTRILTNRRNTLSLGDDTAFASGLIFCKKILI